MANQKNSDLRKYYTIFLEIGLIVSLLIFIVAMKADLPGKQKKVDFSDEKEVVSVTPIPRTTADKQPPAPTEPVVQAKEPVDDPVIDDPDIDTEIKFNEPAPIKPPAITNDGDDEKIFVAVEQEPEIVGGSKALYEKLEYPERCKRAGIQGRVILSFIVNVDGSVEDIKVLRGIGGGCDKAAIDALKQITFKPGKQRGTPVRVQFSWPVTFQLQ